MLAAGMRTRRSGHIGQDGWICRQAAALTKTGRQGVGPAYGSGCAASACASRDWSVLFAPPAASPNLSFGKAALIQRSQLVYRDAVVGTPSQAPSSCCHLSKADN